MSYGWTSPNSAFATTLFGTKKNKAAQNSLHVSPKTKLLNYMIN